MTRGNQISFLFGLWQRRYRCGMQLPAHFRRSRARGVRRATTIGRRARVRVARTSSGKRCCPK